MQGKYVYTKTGKGSRTLSDCRNALPAQECQILSLVNGKFSLDDIQTRLTLSAKEFHAALSFLTQEGYVRRLAKDDGVAGPSTVFGVTELDSEEGVREWAAATRAADALHHRGYYLTREDTEAGAGPQQVLIVDDEPAIGEAVSLVLGGAGFAVEWLGDSRAALDKIKAMPKLALVLLDVMMPHESGFEVLRRIRAQHALRQLPVVMLTARAEREYVSEGLRDGADGYILKPFRPEKLIDYLRDTLRTH